MNRVISRAAIKRVITRTTQQAIRAIATANNLNARQAVIAMGTAADAGGKIDSDRVGCRCVAGPIRTRAAKDRVITNTASE